MQRIEIESKFAVGDRVGCASSKKFGTVSKIWLRSNVIDTLTIQVEINYTVIPDKTSYNAFRVKQENALEVLIDGETGEEFLRGHDNKVIPF
jgi:hypothetical protein